MLLAERTNGDVTVQPGLAESWTVADDLSYTDMEIREGVSFHKGMGDLTAEDVVFTFNEMNPNVTSGAQHDTGGDLTPVLERTEVIDESTVRFHWIGFAAHYHLQWLSNYFEGIGIFSKRAWDEMGEEWMRENPVGTGPFELERYTQNEGIFLTAVSDHWRKTPFVAEVRYLEIPEPSNRRAMLESGQAQIAQIDLKDWSALFDDGFEKAAEEGPANDLGIVMGGNYWETHHPSTGDTLDRTIDTSLPWVGNPYENGDEFDENTPSMQRAKKVRMALGMTIDREGINDSIVEGLGLVSNLGSIGDNDPIFQANADRWTVPYDPGRAKELLEEAGYPDGFRAGFYTQPGIEAEVGDAVTAIWRNELNIDMAMDRQSYSAWRPQRINRTVNQLNFHSMWSAFPATWPGEWLISAVSAPTGFNSGMELPKATETLEAKQSTVDIEELEGLTVEFQDYINEWALYPGVVEAPQAAIYDPQAISEWTMYPMVNFALGGAKAPEFIRLAP